MKIENKLCISDYAKIKEIFNEGIVDYLELLPEIDCGFVKATPLSVSTSDDGYSVSTRISFDDPLGNTIFIYAQIEEDGITKSAHKLDLFIKKPLIYEDVLRKDIDYGLLLIEKVVNYSCKFRDKEFLDNFIIHSNLIDRQVDKSKKEKEMQLRNEKFEAFAIVHAISGFELRVRSLGLVPMYEEYDRFSLYDEKKTFLLLPRSFAMKLLACEKNSLIPEAQFDEKERKVLNDYIGKKYIQSARVGGQTVYFGLNENTRTYLLKVLRTNT